MGLSQNWQRKTTEGFTLFFSTSNSSSEKKLIEKTDIFLKVHKWQYWKQTSQIENISNDRTLQKPESTKIHEIKHTTGTLIITAQT